MVVVVVRDNNGFVDVFAPSCYNILFPSLSFSFSNSLTLLDLQLMGIFLVHCIIISSYTIGISLLLFDFSR